MHLQHLSFKQFSFQASHHPIRHPIRHLFPPGRATEQSKLLFFPWVSQIWPLGLNNDRILPLFPPHPLGFEITNKRVTLLFFNRLLLPFLHLKIMLWVMWNAMVISSGYERTLQDRVPLLCIDTGCVA